MGAMSPPGFPLMVQEMEVAEADAIEQRCPASPTRTVFWQEVAANPVPVMVKDVPSCPSNGVLEEVEGISLIVTSVTSGVRQVADLNWNTSEDVGAVAQVKKSTSVQSDWVKASPEAPVVISWKAGMLAILTSKSNTVSSVSPCTTTVPGM